MHKLYFLIVLFALLLVACATTTTDFRKIISNSTFSDVHRNPKVVENEYFEFKNEQFTYTETRKEFADQFFRKHSYKGSYRIVQDSLLLTVQQMLFCDKDVTGINKLPEPKKGEPALDPDRCSYSYYDIELLKSRNLLKGNNQIMMASAFRIVKNPNTTKIVAIGKGRGKVYEAKEPLTY